MTLPDDKSPDVIKTLPEQTRQAVVEFLTMSSQKAQAPESLADELLDSIALKNCLKGTPRI